MKYAIGKTISRIIWEVDCDKDHSTKNQASKKAIEDTQSCSTNDNRYTKKEQKQSSLTAAVKP